MFVYMFVYLRKRQLASVKQMMPLLTSCLSMNTKEQKTVLDEFHNNNDTGYAWALKHAFDSKLEECTTAQDRQLLLVIRFIHFVLHEDDPELNEEAEKHQHTDN